MHASHLLCFYGTATTAAWTTHAEDNTRGSTPATCDDALILKNRGAPHSIWILCAAPALAGRPLLCHHEAALGHCHPQCACPQRWAACPANGQRAGLGTWAWAAGTSGQPCRTQPGSLCSKLIRSEGLGSNRKCAGLLIEHKLSSLGIPEDKRSRRDL